MASRWLYFLMRAFTTCRDVKCVAETKCCILCCGILKCAKDCCLVCIIYLKVVKECYQLDVPVIVAPYEADAQLTYLVNNDLADYALSEDSDLLAFGCQVYINNQLGSF